MHDILFYYAGSEYLPGADLRLLDESENIEQGKDVKIRALAQLTLLTLEYPRLKP